MCEKQNDLAGIYEMIREAVESGKLFEMDEQPDEKIEKKDEQEPSPGD
ncbi:MAG: hypothetical protein IJF65_00845 [Clostridia bacterium]|nr:hypothetical protein [Clostridia bacterium]